MANPPSSGAWKTESLPFIDPIGVLLAATMQTSRPTELNANFMARIVNYNKQTTTKPPEL